MIMPGSKMMLSIPSGQQLRQGLEQKLVKNHIK